MTYAHEIVTAVKNGQSVRSIVEAALTRAKAVQADLNAFITIAEQAALQRADTLDARIQAGEDVGTLAGVPMVIKDNICTEGILSTAASNILADFVPPYSATVVTRLEAAGAVVIAKANLDEFGMGSSNEHSAYGAVKNPWDTARVPGGSSGGSAAAVAAGVAPIALGTDTGGSVRQPAGFCGLVGFKPTYGRLSRYGVMAFASSLDQVGVLCCSAQDLALTLDAIGGHDTCDATSIEGYEPAFGMALNRKDLQGLRIGVVKELSGEGNSAGVLAAFERMKEKLESLGASLGEVSLPNAKHGISTYYLVAPAEASANLARYDGMVYSARAGENAQGQAEVMSQTRAQGFGAEVRRRILMGTYALSAGYYDAYYGKALKVRQLIANDFDNAFKNYDLLLSPTSPSAAYRIGEKSDDPLAMYLDDIDTVLANLAGLPAVSVPMGSAENDMPCGVQLIAPALQDELLAAVVRVLEDSSDPFASVAPSYA